MRRVYRDGFISYGGRFETNSAVDREPVKLPKKRLGVGQAFRLENNSSNRGVNLLEFM